MTITADGPKFVPPYDRKEKHLPGCNYCGPGTDVNRRMRNKVQPMNRLDQACFKHDLDTETRGPNRAGTDPAKLRASDKRLEKEAHRIALDKKTSRTERRLAWVVYRAMKFNKWRQSRRS